jgi:hypothetical protein
MKGVIELIIVFIILLVMAIVVIFGHLILTNFRTAANGTLKETSVDIIDKGITAQLTYDGVFLFMFIGLVVAVIVSGFYIRTNPIFFVVSIFALVIVVMIAGVFTNAFYDFSTNNSISNSAANYPIMRQIFYNLPIIASFLGIAIIIIWYAKGRGEQGI